MKFIWTPSNVMVLLMRFLFITSLYWIWQGVSFIAEKLGQLVNWLAETLPQVKLTPAEYKDEE